eukprot:Amastigsp_a178909_182.p3 type:complete len:126 gc:universal Amastigsp_a178909_182:458-835(+)
MCSHISIESTRSKVPLSPAAKSNSLMSPVCTRTFRSPRAAAAPSMYWRCVAEFESETIWLRGNRSARYSESEPHPHPRSISFIPSTSSARSQYNESIASSASASVVTPSGYRQLEYLSRGPKHSL